MESNIRRSSKIMKELMPPIVECEEIHCAFNRTSKCHAFAITVGGPDDLRPNCDTFFRTRTQCGKDDILAVVGACKVLTCTFNERLTCLSHNIIVKVHQDRAECATYKSIGNFDPPPSSRLSNQPGIFDVRRSYSPSRPGGG